MHPPVFEDFRGAPPVAPALAGNAVAAPPPLTEADRIAAYEQGYQAGWDDAVRAQAEDQTRIGADFARALQELSFTFHEARVHVIHAMDPFLNQLVETVLPGLVGDNLGQIILDELKPMVEDSADAPVDLVISPANRPALEAQFDGQTSLPIRLIDEPSLAEGQVYLRVGHSERQIDLSGALERIRTAVRSFQTLNERTLKHA
jgi:flagellar assembly protein FliH